MKFFQETRREIFRMWFSPFKQRHTETVTKDFQITLSPVIAVLSQLCSRKWDKKQPVKEELQLVI